MRGKDLCSSHKASEDSRSRFCGLKTGDFNGDQSPVCAHFLHALFPMTPTMSSKGSNYKALDIFLSSRINVSNVTSCICLNLLAYHQELNMS